MYSIAVKCIKQNIQNMKTRLPFQFGITTMTGAPHLFLTAEMEVDGVPIRGLASEGLLPKWFTKDPASTYQEEIQAMLDVIQSACDIAVGLGKCPSVFDLWHSTYQQQKAQKEPEKVPGLLWGFGVSMIERAVIDGYCRAKDVTLRDALKQNLLGIRLGELHEELSGYAPNQFLSFDGVPQMYVRHTVGLTDYLQTGEIPSDERVDDGLPQSLEDCIRAYGLQRFKIKLSGNLNRDVGRLKSIAAILRETGTDNYAFTLDGNENYTDAEDFALFWDELLDITTLKEFLGRLIFVEQPIKRASALSERTGEILKHWDRKPALIIDESDAGIDSLRSALTCGYEGVSHKNCKGVIRGIANACLLKYRAANDPQGRYILSGEDLCNVGPVALLQDLAVSSLLGVDHIERNGHHYFRGLAMYPDDIQDQVLSAHGDLYRRHSQGFPTLSINGGRISVGSLLQAPFGYSVDLDVSRFDRKDEWDYDSLQRMYGFAPSREG